MPSWSLIYLAAMPRRTTLRREKRTRKVALRGWSTITKLCSAGYEQTLPEVFTPGITLQRTSVSSVGNSYPYPKLQVVLYEIRTRTRKF